MKPTTNQRTRDVVTRAKAEKLLAGGADPNLFLKHDNKHVRAKAEKLLAKVPA